MGRMTSLLLVALLSTAAAAAVISDEPKVMQSPEVVETAYPHEVDDKAKELTEADNPMSVATRSNLTTGTIGAGDVVLSGTSLFMPAFPNLTHVHDIDYAGDTSTRITAIRITEVGTPQGATPTIRSGGVGRNVAVIRLQSARGYGYHYTIEIWGR